MLLPTAFVIMPFSPELQVVYEQLICPALDGYDVLRADSRLDERGILEKIITGIRDADLVVADLTSTNANVMYELGIAHALGKPTIMIAQSLLALPFDVRAYPVHEYSTDLSRAAELRTILRDLGERHRAGLLLFSNAVIDFIPELATTPTDHAVNDIYTIENCQRDIECATASIGRFRAAYEAASQRFSTRMSVAIREIGVAAKHEPVPEKNSGITKVADVIRDHGQAIQALLAPIRDSWDRYGRAMLWLAAPPQLMQLTTEQRLFFASEARAFDAVLNGMIKSIADVRAANDRTPKLTGNLAHAVETTHIAQTALLNEIMTGKAYLARVVNAFEKASVESA